MFGPITADEVREYLRAYIDMEHGSITAAAEEWGIARQYVSQILHGGAKPPRWMLSAVGLSGTVPTPQFLSAARLPAAVCPCLPGECALSARECVDWIKRATASEK